MRAGCQVGTKADELLQGAPRVPPSEVLPLPDTPDTPMSMSYVYVLSMSKGKCYMPQNIRPQPTVISAAIALIMTQILSPGILITAAEASHVSTGN